MTDWKALAAARCPDIPADAAERIVGTMEALEEVFRPLVKSLKPEEEPATVFVNRAAAE